MKGRRDKERCVETPRFVPGVSKAKAEPPCGIYGNIFELMELEEKKVTHDFLSHYATDFSFKPEDPRSASQGTL
ncbi:hypothetical protein ZIOFF_045470 [Zingiber officinale]|uniref:Uncharacterized protein n=1 Tax=Zingiber officinale TaxID=94328 RepID=A0A8J5G7T0_ZINOF|nr:hypothetical protein ZIOFF_045470 [Zingiber officinale]